MVHYRVGADPDYTYRYIASKPQYRAAAQAIRPRRVYPDPHYPLTVAIVELPFALPFRCERVVWHVGAQVLTVFKKWTYFLDPAGRNLLHGFYAKDPHPQHGDGTYEAIVVNYEHGCVYADHAHLRKTLRGFYQG